MFKKLYTKVIVSSFLLLIASCFQDDTVTLYPIDEIPGSPVVLGKKLTNPFKPTVMKKALENIRREKGTVAGRIHSLQNLIFGQQPCTFDFYQQTIVNMITF